MYTLPFQNWKEGGRVWKHLQELNDIHVLGENRVARDLQK